MSFNEKKYRRCISRLADLKVYVILVCMILLGAVGAGIAYKFRDKMPQEWQVYSTGAGIGVLIGLLIGLLSIWRIEMKIQESYWRIDVLNELRNQTTVATSNKNTPYAKTVVAIENKQSPTNTATNTQPVESTIEGNN